MAAHRGFGRTREIVRQKSKAQAVKMSQAQKQSRVKKIYTEH